MRRSSSPTDREDREALRTALSLGALLTVIGGVRALTHPAPLSLGMGVLGILIIAGRALFPRWILPPARRLLRALNALGEAVGTVILTVVYLVLVWPYQLLLRALGALPPPEEPWPPAEGTTGWVPLGWNGESPVARTRAAPGALLAELLVRAGGAVSLLAFLRRRPSFLLLPLVTLLLLLGAVVLLGGAAGLGPLIYTLF